MPKILRVTTRLNVGGPSKQILILDEVFNSNDWKQLIVTGTVGDSEAEVDLTQLRQITRIRFMGREIRPFFDFLALLSLLRIIISYKPDIIHTHLSKAWAITTIARFLSLSNAKTVHTFHGHIIHGYYGGNKLKIITMLHKFLSSRTDLLVAVGEEVKTDLLSQGIGDPERFYTINPGFDPPNTINKRDSQESLGLKTDLFTIGFIGRFEPIKRPDILAKVVEITVGSGLPVQFVFCGGGSLYKEFENKVSRHGAVCAPWLNDVGAFYSAVDLMILVSDNEGTPLTIIEAGKIGLPTLSRNVGGIKGMLIDSQNGFLVGESPIEISDRIKEIISNPELLLAVSQNASQFFQGNFDKRVFQLKYEDLYRALIYKQE